MKVVAISILGVLAVAGIVRHTSPHPPHSNSNATAAKPRFLFLKVAKGEIGVKEQNGQNRGPRVDEYNKSANAPLGSPWCASFQHWCGKQIGLTLYGAWSPSWFAKKNVISEKLIREGDFYGIYSRSLGRIAHIGVIMKIDGQRVIGIEGNTNANGSREGNEVRLKSRLIKSLVFSRCLNP